MAGVFGDAGALAVAVFGGRKHTLRFVFSHQHGDYALAVFEHHAAHAACLAAQGANIVFVETYGLATVGKQHHVVLAIGERSADQVVAVIQVDGNDAALARVAEFVQRGLLHGAHAGGHEHVAVGREGAHVASERQHHVDFFTVLQREHVDDGAATRSARAGGHFPHLEPIQAAPVGEAQDVVVRVRDEELVDPVVFLRGCGLLAAPAALLRAVFAQGLALDVAGVAERDHHVGGGDQVFGGEVLRAVFHHAAAGAQLVLAEFLLDGGEFVANDDRYTLGLGQDVEQVFDDRHDFLVLGHDLVLLQAGQALQAHLQNFLGLRVRQAVQAVLPHAKFFFQPLRTIVVSVDHAAIGTGAREHFAHQLAVPGACHQLRLGNGRRG